MQPVRLTESDSSRPGEACMDLTLGDLAFSLSLTGVNDNSAWGWVWGGTIQTQATPNTCSMVPCSSLIITGITFLWLYIANVKTFLTHTDGKIWGCSLFSVLPMIIFKTQVSSNYLIKSIELCWTTSKQLIVFPGSYIPSMPKCVYVGSLELTVYFF